MPIFLSPSHAIIRATNLRASPENLQAIIAVMPRGAIVQVLDTRGAWTQVDFMGRNRQGWCIAESLINLSLHASPAEKNDGNQDLNKLASEDLLQRLNDSDYYATESIAKLIQITVNGSTQSATPQLLPRLMEVLRTAEHSLLRRNILRTLGRLFEATVTQSKHPITQFTKQIDVIGVFLAILEHERNTNVLHDVLWILDSYCYPCFLAQPIIERKISDTSTESAVRFRAMGVWRRLLGQKLPPLPQHDLDFLAVQMNDSDAWVRAEAYFCCEVLKDELVTPSIKARLLVGLQNAWQLEKDRAVRPHIARAIDHFNNNTALLKQLRHEYEQSDLPNEVQSQDGQTRVRSNLPQATLQHYVTVLAQQKRVFFELMGPAFRQPVSNDASSAMTLVIYGSREVYRQYMSGFVGFGADAGGLYIERETTLYTYEHNNNDRYSTEELVKHEYGHYLQGRYVYPGMWGDADYHHEPKGWADEGMAEFLAGIDFDSAGNYQLAERAVYMQPEQLCHGTTLCDLNGLLQRREGYDQQNGTPFDYMNGWAFVHYLMKDRRDIALRLYAGLRENTYALAQFEQIAGVQLAQLQADWHSAMRGWCTNRSDSPAVDGTQCVIYRAGDAPPPALPMGASGQGHQGMWVVRLVK